MAFPSTTRLLTTRLSLIKKYPVVLSPLNVYRGRLHGQQVRWCTSPAVGRTSGVSLTTKPSSALIDEPIQICVDGLEPLQPVTVTSMLTEVGKDFSACGHYVADHSGRLCLESMPSVGGSYKGVEPMGLFWSLSVADNSLARLFKKDVEHPFQHTLSLLPGHVERGDIVSISMSPMAETTLERGFMASGVTRIPVREGRLRGTLFIPADNGAQRFPGIVDLYGTTGGLLETRAALLASRGFATFALAYFGHDDLPGALEPIDLEYFEEALEFLEQHPRVQPGGLGMVGISKGGEIVLHISTISQKVKAVVAINSFFFNSSIAHTYRGQELPCIMPDPEHAVIVDEVYTLNDAYMKAKNIQDYVIPIEKGGDTSYLLIHGNDDGIIDSVNGLHLMGRLKEHGKNSVSLIIYEGAGHLIEPPYSQVCPVVFHKILGAKLMCGGQGSLHAAAQEDAWNRMLHFLRRCLRSEA